MRKGPHPLSVHIGMAASEMARDSAQTGAAGDISYQENFAKMLRGIQRYQCSSSQVSAPPLKTIWQEGEVRLMTLPDQAVATPVVFLPSLVNKANILNLIEGRSMMQYFASQGVAPLLIDWGQSAQDPGQTNFETLIQDRIVSILDFVADMYGQKPHAMGYCMGGTILAAVAALAGDKLASATFLAAPWDFHAGGGALQKRVAFWYPSAMQALESKRVLDQDWLQTVFASLDPLLTRNKFIKFADMEEGTPDHDIFIAIEDWLNDGVDLPYEIAQTCIQRWFFDNKTAQNKWHVGGKTIQPAHIDVPCLVVASKQDRLVEYASAHALTASLKNVREVSPQCGHVGMIAGRHAIKTAWQPMVEFIAYCNNKNP